MTSSRIWAIYSSGVIGKTSAAAASLTTSTTSSKPATPTIPAVPQQKPQSGELAEPRWWGVLIGRREGHFAPATAGACTFGGSSRRGTHAVSKAALCLW